MDINSKQVDEDVAAEDKGDEGGTTQHLDAHPHNAIPQATAGSTPGKAGSPIQNTQSKGTTIGTCVSVVDGTSRCGTPVRRVLMSAAGRDMWRRVIGAMQMA